MLSIGSPSTLNIRPSVLSPTGTVIGAPVETASIPLTSPSVGPMAIHLTVSSPKCCATSIVSSVPSVLVILTASFSSGSCPSLNFTSRTAPIIWVTLPIILSAISLFPLYTNHILRNTHVKNGSATLRHDIA